MRFLNYAAACLAVCGMALAPLASSAHAEDAAKKIKVGFIYVSPVGDEGWSWTHDQGRKMMDAMPDVETTMMESVPEGPDAERAIKNMCSKGYNVIVATSFGYMDPMAKLARRHPDITFLHCSGYKHSDNMTCYFGRIYEARYLTGMVAGAMTKTNEIGYVAAFPIPEVVRGINAFTLGVRSVNPEAKVRVVWTRTWYSPDDEKKAAEGLLDVGVDVIAQHKNSAGPQVAAEERGAYSVGYNTDMSSAAPKAHLVAAVWDWKKFYEKFINEYRAGTWKNGNYWYGLSDGIVDISAYGDMVPADVRAKVDAAKASIVNGTYKVFSGPVKDQEGKERVPAGQVAPDEMLLSMDWFVEGVIGTAR